MSAVCPPKKKYPDPGKIYVRDHPLFTGKFSEFRLENKSDPEVIAAIAEFKESVVLYDAEIKEWREKNPEAAAKCEAAKDVQRCRKRERTQANPAKPALHEPTDEIARLLKKRSKVPRKADTDVPGCVAEETSGAEALSELAKLDDSSLVADLQESVAAIIFLQTTLKSHVTDAQTECTTFMEDTVAKFETLAAAMADTQAKLARCADIQKETLSKIGHIATTLISNKRARAGEDTQG